jgi:geranylgeranyl pyrophosphate synthase
LFRAACELGELESRSRPRSLGLFGERIGLAFQILDDVLDVSGPPERTGKPWGTDLLDGTVTLPLIVARERDPSGAPRGLRRLCGPDEAAAVCEWIASTGALTVAKDHAVGLAEDAKGLLSDLPARQRAALELVADGVVERYA